jgi:hypothetical protein
MNTDDAHDYTSPEQPVPGLDVAVDDPDENELPPCTLDEAARRAAQWIDAVTDHEDEPEALVRVLVDFCRTAEAPPGVVARAGRILVLVGVRLAGAT